MEVADYDAGWDWTSYTYTDLWTVEGAARNLFFNGWHPVVPWVAFLLWGMTLARKDLSDRPLQLRMLLVGASVGAIAELASLLISTTLQDPELLMLFDTEPVPPVPLYMIAALGWATAAIGGCLLISARVSALRWLHPAGRQTLSLYLAHIILGMGMFEALGWLENRTGMDALWASIVFVLLSVLYALAWQRWISQSGPMERVLRKLSR